MALLDIQQRSRELGRIRIGSTVKYTKDGEEKKRPVKLEAFRLTTPSQRNAIRVAEVFGGEAVPWDERPGQWQVMTTATELPIMVPPGHPLTQNYELWSGGGIQRRCNGVEQENGRKCACPAAIDERMAAAARGNACKPMSRLSVVLPDLMDLGAWLVVSGGYNAAIEWQGAADFLQKLALSDVFLPAQLRLEQRSQVVDGQTRHYGVVAIEVGATMRELASGTLSRDGMTLPAAPPGVKALEAGHAQPPPPNLDEPEWQRPADDEDDGIVDAEVVVDSTIIAEKSAGCATRADVQVLVDEAQRHGLIGEVVTDPIGGGRLTLRDLLTAKWKALPE